MEEIIMGLDISTKSTGVAIFRGKNLIYYDCLVSASTNVYNRIESITSRLEDIVKRYHPTRIISEEPEPAHVKNNIDVYRKLTFAHGAICMMLNHYSLDMEMVTSSHWRKEAGIKTGRGVKREELKKIDIDTVKTLYNIDVNDDVADAILIGKSAIKNSLW